MADSKAKSRMGRAPVLAAAAVLMLAATPVFANSGKNSRIVAVNGPLSQVLADLGRHFNGEIILADADMGHRVVKGAYDMDNPALTLQTIVEPLGGLVTEVTPWMLIVSAEQLMIAR